MRHITLLPLLLALASTTVNAQVAAEETWRLVTAVAAPWGKPIGPRLEPGATMRLAQRALEAPAPLSCSGATHTFMRTPAAGLFEGLLPAPAEASAKALGLPADIVTQRVTCSNGSFDVHRSANGANAWMGLNNTVLKWERINVAASSEATVQGLLLQHYASDMAFSRASVAAQSARLSKTLLEKLNAWFKRVAGSDEVPYLNGDPYTDSQEPPDTFELAAAQMQDTRAELTVTFRGPSIAPYPVHVQLVRAQSGWRIDDFRYRDGQRLSQVLER